MRVPVKLRESINTDTLEQDVKPIGEGPHRVNTGIERDGGITNSYLFVEPASSPPTVMVADNGKEIVIDGTSGLVSLGYPGGTYNAVGRVVRHGTQSLQLNGLVDATIAKNLIGVSEPTILGLNYLPGFGLTYLVEYNLNGVELRRRFVGAYLGQWITLVKRFDIAYIDAVEVVYKDLAGAINYGIEGGATNTFNMTGTTFQKAPYVYKYNATNYLVHDQLAKLAGVGAINVGGAILAPFDCWYCVPDHNNALARHIITKKPVLNGVLVEAVALLGYTAFGAFSAIPLWQTPGGMAATAVDANIYRVGYGYVEAFYTQAGVVRCLSCPEINTTGATAGFISDWAIGIAQPADYFGLLNGFSGTGLTFYAMFRIFSINGVQSGISFCMDESAPVEIGTAYRGKVLTPVGEFDPTWTPQQVAVSNISAYSAIIYKSNDTFYLVAIIPGIESTPAQGIARNTYKLNTVSVLDIVDADREVMYSSGSDFNGRFTEQGGSGTATMLRALQMSGVQETGIDTGEKITLANAAQIIPIGCSLRAEEAATLKSYAKVKEYDAGLYATTWISGAMVGGATGGISYSDPGDIDLIYTPYTFFPIPAGAKYYEPSAQWVDWALFRVAGKPYYLIGNKVNGKYTGFILFGNTYGYTDGRIYLFPISAAGYIQSPQLVATGQSLTLIAVAPTMVFFHSAWDNSLYSFDGGRNLVKGVRLSQIGGVTDGIWNVAENALTLNASTSLVFVRDGIITNIPKNSDQLVRTIFFSTDAGTIVLGKSFWYKYDYKPIGAIQPITWKSAFWGMDATRQQYLSQAIYTIYSPTKEHLDLKLYAQTFDEAQTYPEQIQAVTVEPADYSSSGFVRVRLQPQIQRGLATSIGLSCPQKIVLLDVAVDTVEVEPAAITAARSV